LSHVSNNLITRFEIPNYIPTENVTGIPVENHWYTSGKQIPVVFQWKTIGIPVGKKYQWYSSEQGPVEIVLPLESSGNPLEIYSTGIQWIPLELLMIIY
jgi:hypothetical protein